MGTAWAMSGNQGGGAGGAGSMMSFLPMLVVMFLIMYFLIIRPQQKKQKDAQNMLEKIKKGNKVLTAGGIIGVVSSVNDNVVVVKISENTKVEFKKTAITKVFSGEEPA